MERECRRTHDGEDADRRNPFISTAWQTVETACILLVFTKNKLQGTNTMHARALVDRVRGEFNEMPGLQLTIPQAARLLGIEPDACRDVIDTLVASAFLKRTPAGKIVRAERSS